MNSFRQTWAYLFKYGKGKRFLLFFLVLLVPCAIAAYFFPVNNYVSFFFDYNKLGYFGWSELWLNFFNYSPSALIGGACSIVLFVFAISYITTVMTRHVRVGEFSFPKLLYSVNENFFPAVAITFFLLFTLTLTHFVFTLFLYMWMQLASRIFALVMSLLTFLILLVAAVYLLAATTLWLPTMSFTGQYVFKALGTAFYKSRSYQKYFFLPTLLAAVSMLIVSIGAHFTRGIWYVQWIINTITYTFVLVYSLTFNIISYCETEAVTREDLVKSYFGR